MDIHYLKEVVKEELGSRSKRPKYQNSELSWILKYLSAYEKRLEAEEVSEYKDKQAL